MEFNLSTQSDQKKSLLKLQENAATGRMVRLETSLVSTDFHKLIVQFLASAILFVATLNSGISMGFTTAAVVVYRTENQTNLEKPLNMEEISWIGKQSLNFSFCQRFLDFLQLAFYALV